MARRFLDDVRSDINTLFADNIIGAITPARLRTSLRDIIDSTIQDEGVISISAPITGVVLPSTFTNLTGFVNTLGGDGTFIKLEPSNNRIVTAATAGFTYTVFAGLSFEGVNNEEVEFAIGYNGVQGDYTPIATARGLGRPLALQIRGLTLSAAANTNLTFMARAVDGTATIDILDMYLAAIINPTNNP